MFTTILIGVDDRQGGRDALTLAQSLSDLGGGDLLAVHVYPVVPRDAVRHEHTADPRTMAETTA